jgi:hypothetical protein
MTPRCAATLNPSTLALLPLSGKALSPFGRMHMLASRDGLAKPDTPPPDRDPELTCPLHDLACSAVAAFGHKRQERIDGVVLHDPLEALQPRPEAVSLPVWFDGHRIGRRARPQAPGAACDGFSAVPAEGDKRCSGRSTVGLEREAEHGAHGVAVVPVVGARRKKPSAFDRHALCGQVRPPAARSTIAACCRSSSPLPALTEPQRSGLGRPGCSTRSTVGGILAMRSR